MQTANPITSLLSVLVLAGCLPDEPDKYQQLSAAATRMSEEGIGDAYWIEMESIVGWEPVVLVFGYVDDGSACEEIRALASQSKPTRDYRCVPARE